MKILIDMNHPKDVNVFRNVIKKLEEKGNKVKIVAANKENLLEILDSEGFEYSTKKHYKGLLNKALGMLKNDYRIYKVSKEFSPDIFASFGSPYAAQASKLLGKKHISFSDTDTSVKTLNQFVITTLLFSEVDYVPACHKKDRGSKQKRFNGYYELAYLSPKYFEPDQNVLEKLGISPEDRYILLRFSALNAHHDVGAYGFNFKTEEETLEYIKSLESYGSVYISSEIKLGNEFEKYRLSINPKDFHSFLSFSSLYIGEGASMASEAAILGVPSIYVSNTRRGYLDELEEKYDLEYTISDNKIALDKAIYLLKRENLREEWKQKKEKMLKEKIDVVEFMVDKIEKYGSNKM